MTSAMALQTAAKYHGAVAVGYEERRQGKDKWRGEERVVREMLGDLPAGTTILDIPFGTGRFIPFYHERGFKVLGLDISPDMLREAANKTIDTRLIDFARGDIFKIDAHDKSFDVTVSIRIMNLINADDMKRALGELQRVARKRVIFNLRVWHPHTHYRRPQKMENLTKSIMPGWRIERDQEIHEPDFRMFMLCNG